MINLGPLDDSLPNSIPDDPALATSENIDKINYLLFLNGVAREQWVNAKCQRVSVKPPSPTKPPSISAPPPPPGKVINTRCKYCGRQVTGDVCKGCGAPT